jgi:hypothetical protein
MALTSLTPNMAFPVFGGLTYPNITPGLPVVTTGTTPVTCTVPQLLSGLMAVDCQDAGTLTLPTAALINAALPAQVGLSFEVDVINFGDSTLTLAVGTGITAKVVGAQSTAAVLTMATLVSKRLRFVCTKVASAGAVGSSDAYDLYAFGSIAAAVA